MIIVVNDFVVISKNGREVFQIVLSVISVAVRKRLKENLDVKNSNKVLIVFVDVKDYIGIVLDITVLDTNRKGWMIVVH